MVSYKKKLGLLYTEKRTRLLKVSLFLIAAQSAPRVLLPLFYFVHICLASYHLHPSLVA